MSKPDQPKSLTPGDVMGWGILYAGWLLALWCAAAACGLIDWPPFPRRPH